MDDIKLEEKLDEISSELSNIGEALVSLKEEIASASKLIVEALQKK